MTEERPPEENLTDELRRLGKNLSEALRSAWESPERRRLQQELETGLNELTDTIRSEVRAFSESPTGQRFKADVEDVRQKVRSGEAETRVREELVNALRTVNAELQKVSERWASQETGGKEGEQAPEKHEIHPDDVDSTSPEPPRQEIHPDDVDSGTRA
jgi:uncharacterized membrane protein YccC